MIPEGTRTSFNPSTISSPCVKPVERVRPASAPTMTPLPFCSVGHLRSRNPSDRLPMTRSSVGPSLLSSLGSALASAGAAPESTPSGYGLVVGAVSGVLSGVMPMVMFKGARHVTVISPVHPFSIGAGGVVRSGAALTVEGFAVCVPRNIYSDLPQPCVEPSTVG